MIPLGPIVLVVAALYVLLGWMAVPVLPSLGARLGAWPLALLFGGGLLYTAGAAIYAYRRPESLPGGLRLPRDLPPAGGRRGTLPLRGGRGRPPRARVASRLPTPAPELKVSRWTRARGCAIRSPRIMRPSETTREQLLPLSTDAELRRRFMVLREPIPGNFRFGVLLEVLDRLAGETALEYIWRFVPDAGAVTAALDEIVVRRAPDVTQDVRCSARINHVGRTSMEVGIRVESAAERTHLASCYFTMVARAHDRSRSIEIPKLEPGDDLERVRAARAVTRRAAYRRELETAVEPPSRDEYMMLSALHRAQEAPGFQGLRASDLVAETWERTFPEQENPWRAIFGGYIMRRAYELSSICAERISQHGHRPVIAAVNRITFI